ncbi:hypothetical protein BJV74DRAFT_884524 [Russula compacta]|nr:hypothetical protein BJV74DRAFT_884524 [Russula compacta]
MSSSFLDTSQPRPKSTRLFSLKRPFSKPKPEPYPLILSNQSHEPGPSSIPPSYEQIRMGLHLSRTPHIPAHLAHLYPPAPQPRLQRTVSSPVSSAKQRERMLRPTSAHLHPSPYSRAHSRSPTPSRSPSRSYTPLPPPPARSALKKTRENTTATSSSVTPDTASASTVASSIPPPTPTSSPARSRLFARILGKERDSAPALVAIIAEPESEPERKAVRFEVEDESC